MFGILGANGSGKSTLIRLVSGLLTLDEGRVEVFGHDIARDEMTVKRLINRVSVDAAFFKKLSPMENLIFAARLYGLDAGRAREDAYAILERLGIARKRVDRPVEQMSRGMQQKVAIARALLTSPALLLLDEPTTGLDPRSKLEVQAFIEDVRTTHDASIVLTTHDLDEADRLCDRISVLNDGRVVAEDSPNGLKRLVAEVHGQEPTLHNVFMTYTGRSLDEDVEEDAERRRLTAPCGTKGTKRCSRTPTSGCGSRTSGSLATTATPRRRGSPRRRADATVSRSASAPRTG